MKLLWVILIAVLVLGPLAVRAQQDEGDDAGSDLAQTGDDQQYDTDNTNSDYGDDSGDQNSTPSPFGDDDENLNQSDEDGMQTTMDQDQDSATDQTTESSSGRRRNDNKNKSSEKGNSNQKSSGRSRSFNLLNKNRRQQDELDNEGEDQATSTTDPNSNDDYQPTKKSGRNNNKKNSNKKNRNLDFYSGSQFNGEGPLEDNDADENADGQNNEEDSEYDQNGQQQQSSKSSKRNGKDQSNNKSLKGKNQQQQGSKNSSRLQQGSDSGSGSRKKRNERRIYANFTEQEDFSGMEAGMKGIGGGRGNQTQLEPLSVDYYPKYNFQMVTQTLPFEVTVTRINTIKVNQTRPIMMMETTVISSTVVQNQVVSTTTESISTLTLRAPLTPGATRFRTVVQPTTTRVQSSSVVTSTVQPTPHTVYITQTGEPYCFFADVRPTVIIRTQLVTEATQHYMTQLLQNTQLSSPQDRYPLVNATADATITLTKTRFVVNAKTENRNVTVTSMTPVLKRNVTTIRVPVTSTAVQTSTSTLIRTVTITDYDLPQNAAALRELQTEFVMTTIMPTFTRTDAMLKTKLITNQITVYSSVYQPNHECQRVANFNVTHTVLAVTTTTTPITLYQYQVATYPFNEFDGKFNASQAAAARNATMQARLAQQQQLGMLNSGRRQRGGLQFGIMTGINPTRTFGRNQQNNNTAALPSANNNQTAAARSG